MIQFRCRSCGEQMEAPQSLVGQLEPCPRCGQEQLVPSPTHDELGEQALQDELAGLFVNEPAASEGQSPSASGLSTPLPSQALPAAGHAPPADADDIVYCCRFCNGLVKAPRAAAGTMGVCPHCHRREVVPRRGLVISPTQARASAGLPAGSSASTAVTAPLASDPLALAALSMGAAAGASGSQSAPGMPIVSKAAWNLAVTQWMSDLPEQKSAYTPSGVLPSTAAVLMLLGGLLGVPAGMLATAVVGGVTAVIVFLLALLIGAMGEVCGVIWCLPVAFAFIIGLVGGLLALLAWGAAPAWVIAQFGKMGKNRNVSAPVLVALGSTAISVLALVAAYGEWPLWTALPLMIVPLIAAGMTAGHMVAQAKFCEECQLYMQHQELKGLSYGGSRLLAAAMQQQSANDAQLEPFSVGLGNVGTPKLFHCPRCGQGYLELTVAFSADWKKAGKQDETESVSKDWLAGSVAVPSAQVGRLKRFVK